MPVKKRIRKSDGYTVYSAEYFGPGGRKIAEKVKALPPSAPERAHRKARAEAEAHMWSQREAVKAGTWVDPKSERAKGAIPFPRLVELFLRGISQGA